MGFAGSALEAKAGAMRGGEGRGGGVFNIAVESIVLTVYLWLLSPSSLRPPCPFPGTLQLSHHSQDPCVSSPE